MQPDLAGDVPERLGVAQGFGRRVHDGDHVVHVAEHPAVDVLQAGRGVNDREGVGVRQLRDDGPQDVVRRAVAAPGPLDAERDQVEVAGFVEAREVYEVLHLRGQRHGFEFLAGFA